MGLETATYIDDLVATNPTGGDDPAQGDDHIRLIKSALLNSFPEVDAAVTVGSWTPALAGAGTAGTGWVLSTATGAYVKFGRLVFITGKIVTSTVSGTAAGQILITGLPATVATGEAYESPMNVSVTSIATSIVSVSAQAIPASTTIGLARRTDTSVSGANMTPSDLDGSSNIWFSGWYIAAA